MKYDHKYNTPGLRMPKKQKDAFGHFKKRIDRERPHDERRQTTVGLRPSEKKAEEPRWMRRTYLALAIPAVLATFFGIGYLLLLNVGSMSSAAIRQDQRTGNELTYEQIQALPVADQYVYYGQRDMNLLQYRAARHNYQQALQLDPAHAGANMGLYAALRGLVKEDRGWKKQLREQEERMRVLRGE